MRKLALILGVAATVVIGAGLAISVRADRREVRLRAELRGLNEVPPTSSRASGTLRATLDQDAQTITFTLDFKDMSGPPSMSHIHFGPPRVNGGVMVFFCGGGGKPSCPNATSGTVTGTIAVGDVVGPGAQGITAGDFADVVRAIATGNGYANIHSALFPAGEARGRVESTGFDRDDGDRDHDHDD
jgi:hypothetical protein